MERLTGSCKRQTRFVRVARGSQSAFRLVQMRQIHPQLGTARCNQHHPFGDLDCPCAFTRLQGAKFQIRLKPQKHVDICERLQLRRCVGAKTSGRRRCAKRLLLQRRSAIEWIDKRLAAAQPNAEQKMPGRIKANRIEPGRRAAWT